MVFLETHPSPATAYDGANMLPLDKWIVIDTAIKIRRAVYPVA